MSTFPSFRPVIIDPGQFHIRPLSGARDRMKRISLLMFLLALAPVCARSQAGMFRDSLLDRMTGGWVLQGTIAGGTTTHDVDVAWVLEHRYLQIHEVSREKDSTGAALYEALVYIGWDATRRQYSCLWLDVTGSGGISPQLVAFARPERDRMAFLFKGEAGSLFHTTFVYDRRGDRWQWLMDDDRKGKLTPFARVTLARR